MNLNNRAIAIQRAFGPRTRKQALFLKHFLDVDGAAFNATKAAIMAGYSEKTAYSIGHELKNKPHIAATIALHHLCWSIPHRLRFDQSIDYKALLAEEVVKYLNGE